MPIVPPIPLSKDDLAALVPLIDEYGAIRARIAAAQTDVKRAEEIREHLLRAAGEFPPDQSRLLKGKLFDCLIAPRTQVKRIDVSMLFAKLGMHKFLKICSVTVKDMSSVLAGDVAAKFVTEAQTGPRIVKAIPASDS